ncbi:hypothetical protein [Candidatus Parabeggiatoa sp. HSG14]|uniref:hypothetical protein n=1 Tax=Candidatus Parabeggiatoa sp. HSG14 TaxID=3055593 RepID=UPI0025A82AEA|nr:hypothetical protein [Thiotrichales bacterium HSG14]
MNNHIFHSIGLTIAYLMLLIIVLSSCTSQEDQMKQYKKQAVNAAWEHEKKLVRLGHKGTREWDKVEKEELIKTGKVSGYEGQYINDNFEENPKLIKNPNNIAFLRMGETFISEEDLQLSSLRSYILRYEKNKYSFWVTLVGVVIFLIIAVRYKLKIIINSALAGAAVGAIWLGMVFNWSLMAIVGGFAAGLVAGTIIGVFMFLFVISLGLGLA